MWHLPGVWPWKRPRKAEDHELRVLEERVALLEASWEEWKDKVYRWMKRTDMRTRADAPAPSAADPVLARIMARRSAVGRRANAGTGDGAADGGRET